MDLDQLIKEKMFNLALEQLREVDPALKQAQEDLRRLQEERPAVVEQLVQDRMNNIRSEVESMVSQKEGELLGRVSELSAKVLRLEQMKSENAAVEVIG